MPKVSAAINAIEAREPPMSGLPVAMMTVPSSLTCTLALDSPPPLNQYPGGDAAPLIGPERRLVGRMIHQCLDGLDIAAMAELWAIDHRGTGPRRASAGHVYEFRSRLCY